MPPRPTGLIATATQLERDLLLNEIDELLGVLTTEQLLRLSEKITSTVKNR